MELVQDKFGWTTLHRAAHRNDKNVVKELVESGYCVNTKDSSSWSALHHAVVFGDVATVAELVKAGADVNAKTSKQESVLHCAVFNKNADVLVPFLIAHRAVSNCRNKEEETPLICATRLKKVTTVAALLTWGADVNAADGQQRTALHWAPTVNAIEALLSAGADITGESNRPPPPSGIAAAQLAQKRPCDSNVEINYPTPLHCAISRGKKAGLLACKLINEGAQVNHRSGNQGTLLHEAAHVSASPVIEALVNAGIKVNATDNNSYTALHEAVIMNADVLTVSSLLKHKADVNLRSHKGWTALHYAARYNNNPQITQLLLDHKADIDAKTDMDMTPLHLAVTRNPNVEVINLLLAKTNINRKYLNNKNNTLLHMAAECNTEHVVNFLINQGALPDEENNSEHTPLQIAAQLNASPSVSVALIQSGADIHAKRGTDGRATPLHKASSNNNPYVIQALIDTGSNVNAFDFQHNTPLHCAIKNNKIGAVRALLNGGANPNLTTPNGWTALHFASTNGTPSEVEALLKAGADPTIQDLKGWIPLEYAAKFNPGVLEIFLDLCFKTASFQPFKCGGTIKSEDAYFNESTLYK